jgi:transcription termination factor Rho
MAAGDLTNLHLAELHGRAAELGVPGYRLLRRSELIAAIEAGGAGAEATLPFGAIVDTAVPTAEQRAPRERRERRPSARRERLPAAEEESEAGEPVSGVLEITPQRFGFLRLSGLEAHPDDVYISASQVRRCELRPGDEVSGPARPPRRGERHRALVHVDEVNGREPEGERLQFDSLTPVMPRRRLPLDGQGADVLTRAVDLLAPLALGQRVLVSAAPRSGRTTLLRGLARAIAAARGPELIVLLVDERPEEATAWREAVPDAVFAAAPADLAPAEQVRIARLALERARRRVEAGADVVLVADSLSRLAVAANDAGEVKRLFGSGRDLAEEAAGSLTVIASVVAGADDDGQAERAIATTESSRIVLDAQLAAAGIVPALRPAECRVSNEEELRPSEELDAVRRFRSLLADLGPAEAAALLRERIEASTSNAELLRSL